MQIVKCPASRCGGMLTRCESCNTTSHCPRCGRCVNDNCRDAGEWESSLVDAADWSLCAACQGQLLLHPACGLVQYCPQCRGCLNSACGAFLGDWLVGARKTFSLLKPRDLVCQCISEQKRTIKPHMEKQGTYEKDAIALYKSLLFCKQFKQPVIVITLDVDDAGEQLKRRKASCDFYGKKLNCSILNPAPVVFGCERLAFGDGCVDYLREVVPQDGSDDLILVFTTHGNIQWFFGVGPGNEEACAKKVAARIADLEKTLGRRCSRIVLDACWSGAELLDPPNRSAGNKCPARCLSEKLGKCYWVYGVNGEAGDGHVSLAKQTKCSYADMVVVFWNGDVVKSCQRDGPIVHETPEKMRKRPFYIDLFGGEVPVFYETTSFQPTSSTTSGSSGNSSKQKK
jgi:hypothetical protein